ncbi:MAG: hypothetical protein JJU35_08565, partial [Balneolales bacterium]|nr:hypothetical protein [Balneolales bacterium]
MVSGLIFLVFLFQQNPFSTQASPEHIVKQFTIADGLPLNAVWQVVQAEDGFLYMATFDGLVRFDGYEFITFNKLNSEGLSSTRLMSVGIDSENLIWVASPYGNLSSFDGFTFTNHDQTNLSELPLFTGLDAIGEQVALLGSAKGRAIPFLQEHTLTVNESRILIDSTFVRIGGQVVLDNEELRGGFEDAEGTIWVYTRNNGLFQIKESKVRNFSSGSGI